MVPLTEDFELWTENVHKKGEESLSVDTHIHTNALGGDSDKDVCVERENWFLTSFLHIYWIPSSCSLCLLVPLDNMNISNRFPTNKNHFFLLSQHQVLILIFSIRE